MPSRRGSSSRCKAGFVARHDTSGYDTDDEDRRIADLHYRDVAEYAVGRNVSGAWRADDDGVVRRVWTDPLPVAEVERVAANDGIEGVTFEMEALAQAAEAGGDGDSCSPRGASGALRCLDRDAAMR